jgi:transcriptional regulator
MYVPPFNAVPDEAEVRALVETIDSAELVTVGPDGYPLATLLPIIWKGDRVIAHLARANDHWRSIEPDSPALFVCTGPDAYVSPSWYASKREHGRAVPTWNYASVHLSGRVRVYDDHEWLRDAVTILTERHEGRREEPWQVTDAPAAYVEAQLRGIVGLEMTVERVEAKRKLSQNRSEADRRGVVEGLRAESPTGGHPVADAMAPML